MKKILFILLTLLMIGCESHSRKRQNNTNLVYTAKSNLYGVYNKIGVKELDSVLNKKSIKRLNEYNAGDSIEKIAFGVLKKELIKQDVDTSGLLIKWVKKLNDSVIEFRICHLDDVVFEYNLGSMPSPITGSISGYDGWYRVNINKKRLRISYAQ